MIAIPLSIMAAVIILQYQDVSLNIMTLGGLAIAIGLLVDDAVITVENIFRRVRENNALASPRPTSSVVLNATLEVRGAVVYATLAIVLVFLPVLTLTGVAGRLFGPLVVAYISATFASLIVALLVTPVLSLLLISGAKKEPVTIRWLKEKYKKLLDRMERLTVPILIAAAVFLVGGFLTLFFVHRTYLPPMNENFLVLHLDFAPGTSLEESIRVGKLVTDDLLKIDGVQSVGQRAGRGELGEDIHGTHQSELDISVSSKNVAQLIEKMRDLLSQYPGTHYEIDSFLMERINDTLSGYVADFIINVFGNNFDELDAAASQIAEKLASIPGAKDILIQSPPGTPEVTIGLRKDDLRQWGLQTADVLNTISTAFQGKTVGQIYQGNRIIDVVVILDPKERDQPDKARHLLLKNPSNQYIELEQVADIFTDSGRYNIEHRGGRRVMPVTCNISGVSVRAFEDQVRSQIISKLNLPSGMYVEIQGVAAAEKTAENQLLFNSLIAALIILALLYMILGSFPYLLLLLCNLPFALVGGILSLFFMQGILSVGSMIGFVTVFGITLRNSIMIALHAQHLVIYEGKPWNRDTVIQSVQERLAPILMTALATAFGLLPIALENGRPGNEIESPVAIVILGGLITSTLLNLLILPLLMLRFSRSLTPQKNKSSEEI
jgi:Cu/Ag efflux pump CusA